MTHDFPKPRIVLSKCLGFAACRYNGLMFDCPSVRKLRKYVDFVPVCPELELGLGTPRHPIRILESKGRRTLFQPATGRDLTREMTAFVRKFLRDLGPVDGFLLKSRSPSCGLSDVKVYSGSKRKQALLTAKSHGFFGGLALKLYPGLAIADERRLENPASTKRFLARVSAMAGLREALGPDSPNAAPGSSGPRIKRKNQNTA
jgi:uncharacterized protein YbbK (DUF523 family)